MKETMMETATRELQVPQCRSDLMDAIDRLGKQLDVLEQRLSSVLMPAGPTTPAGLGQQLSKIGDHRVELAEFLFAQRNRVNLFTDQIQQILNRCEL